MDEIQMVEVLERAWSTTPKGQITEKTVRKEVFVGFAVEVGRFHVWVSGVVGPKSGISEEVYILDASQRIVADRLHVVERAVYDGHFLPVTDMRRAVLGDHEDPLLVVRRYVEGCLERFAKGDFTEGLIASHHQLNLSTSPLFASAGTPGGGKRR